VPAAYERDVTNATFVSPGGMRLPQSPPSRDAPSSLKPTRPHAAMANTMTRHIQGAYSFDADESPPGSLIRGPGGADGAATQLPAEQRPRDRPGHHDESIGAARIRDCARSVDAVQGQARGSTPRPPGAHQPRRSSIAEPPCARPAPRRAARGSPSASTPRARNTRERRACRAAGSTTAASTS